jgi:hypothetical protein
VTTGMVSKHGEPCIVSHAPGATKTGGPTLAAQHLWPNRCVARRTPERERNVIMDKKHAVCMLCAKPSSKAICDVCADHLRGEALDKKKKDEKIRE